MIFKFFKYFHTTQFYEFNNNNLPLILSDSISVDTTGFYISNKINKLKKYISIN